MKLGGIGWSYLDYLSFSVYWPCTFCVRRLLSSFNVDQNDEAETEKGRIVIRFNPSLKVLLAQSGFQIYSSGKLCIIYLFIIDLKINKIELILL